MAEHDKRDPRTYAIIGAAMEVHRVLGCGFLEPVYQEALAEEFAQRGIQFHQQVEFPVPYKGKLLEATYRADFVCFGTVIVEVKALTALGSTEEAQILNYLKASGLELGLLLNFGATSLQYRRFVRSTKASGKSAQSADDHAV
jgi:GxxExxY protein